VGHARAWGKGVLGVSGWFRSEVWRGSPLKRIAVSSVLLRANNLAAHEWFSAEGLEKNAFFLTLLFEAAGAIPRDSYLVGVCRPANQDIIEFTFQNKDFAPIAEWGLIPVEVFEGDLRAAAERLAAALQQEAR